MIVITPLRYWGAKWAFADWIVARLPSHERFVSVFGGSAAVLLSKPPSLIEIYNDVDSSVVSFWRVLRQSSEELARLIEATPSSREEHRNAFDETTDELEKARRFRSRCWQSLGGYRTRQRASWKRPKYSNVMCDWLKVPNRIRAVAERMRRVHLECADWREILTSYDGPNTLFYCDPPYLDRCRQTPNMYTRELAAPSEHEELLQALRVVDGAVVISGYDDPMYNEMLAEWPLHRKVISCIGNTNRVEYLWVSTQQIDLFSWGEGRSEE